jgi:hypothetical protein
MMSGSPRDRRMTSSHLLALAAVAVVALGAVLAACAEAPSPPPRAAGSPAVTVDRRPFHGWEALVLQNAVAEVTVVPAIGRIMQIGLRGEAARAPLWSHPGIGPQLPPDENGWINFGGDKAWPAPQSQWGAVLGKGWPPPPTFDASAFAAEVAADGSVTLVSPIDPAYGVRIRRTIALDPQAPLLTVETCYQKEAGPPVRVGVWTITQLASPERIFLRLPERSAFPGGFTQRLPDRPKELGVEGRLLSLARDPAAKTMLASDGEAMLWVGNGPDLLIETIPAAHDPGREWPDGAHAQIYTSSDAALPYVELELLSPLRDLKLGERACLGVRYTLHPRAEADARAEARRVLGL